MICQGLQDISVGQSVSVTKWALAEGFLKGGAMSVSLKEAVVPLPSRCLERLALLGNSSCISQFPFLGEGC